MKTSPTHTPPWQACVRRPCGIASMRGFSQRFEGGKSSGLCVPRGRRACDAAEHSWQAPTPLQSRRRAAAFRNAALQETRDAASPLRCSAQRNGACRAASRIVASGAGHVDLKTRDARRATHSSVGDAQNEVVAKTILFSLHPVLGVMGIGCGFSVCGCRPYGWFAWPFFARDFGTKESMQGPALGWIDSAKSAVFPCCKAGKSSYIEVQPGDVWGNWVTVCSRRGIGP